MFFGNFFYIMFMKRMQFFQEYTKTFFIQRVKFFLEYIAYCMMFANFMDHIFFESIDNEELVFYSQILFYVADRIINQQFLLRMEWIILDIYEYLTIEAMMIPQIHISHTHLLLYLSCFMVPTLDALGVMKAEVI